MSSQPSAELGSCDSNLGSPLGSLQSEQTLGLLHFIRCPIGSPYVVGSRFLKSCHLMMPTAAASSSDSRVRSLAILKPPQGLGSHCSCRGCRSLLVCSGDAAGTWPRFYPLLVCVVLGIVSSPGGACLQPVLTWCAISCVVAEMAIVPRWLAPRRQLLRCAIGVTCFRVYRLLHGRSGVRYELSAENCALLPCDAAWCQTQTLVPEVCVFGPALPPYRSLAVVRGHPPRIEEVEHGLPSASALTCASPTKSGLSLTRTSSSSAPGHGCG